MKNAILSITKNEFVYKDFGDEKSFRRIDRKAFA